MIETWKSVRITDKATHAVIGETCVLFYAVISVGGAGSNWTIKIQDKAGTPFVLSSFELALSEDGQPIVMNFKDFPIPMDGGIDIITDGTTAGEAVVRMYVATAAAI